MKVYVLVFICFGLSRSNQNISTVHVCKANGVRADSSNSLNAGGAFEVSVGPEVSRNCSAVVKGIFHDSIEEIGQSRLLIDTLPFPEASDLDYFFSMGFAEGYLTAKRIVQQLHNVVWSGTRKNAIVESFFEKQYAFMRRNAESLWESDSYWFQVRLELARLDGIFEGLVLRQTEQSRKNEEQTPPSADDAAIWPYYRVKMQALYQLNSNAELAEIAATGEAGTPDFLLPVYEMAEVTKCSALVKLVNGDDAENSDLIIGHNTWTEYSEMLRIYKTLSFRDVVHESFRNRKISMSSYPGYLASMDDWLILSDSELLVTETTNDCYSQKRLREFVTSDSVTTMIRSLVASRMSSSGKKWFENFSIHNSGTYNNQWIIVDYKKFNDWKSSPNNRRDILWVGEQAPGLMLAEDMTNHLFENSYWASYNRPYFKKIAKVCGYEHASMLRGEWYLHDKCPRARMFRSLHSKVKDVGSMKAVMTLNRYEDDSRNECPKNQIAARFDLDAGFKPESKAFRKCGPVMDFGAIDCKIVDNKMMKNDEIIMISGPLWNNTAKPFEWTENSKTPHWGHPKQWKFDFVKWKASSVEWSNICPSERLNITLPITAILPEYSASVM